MQVSVIMPVYNGAATLETAIQSIITQTLQSWELVVVDDGSSDETPLILAKMAKNEQRIRVHRNRSNLGIGAALNIAWRKSSSSLIARMDADDFSLPDRLQRQVAFMTAHPEVSVLGTAVEIVDTGGNRLGFAFRPETNAEIVARLYKETPVFHPTVVMRRSFLNAMNGYDERLRRSEDLDLWLRSYHQFRFHNLPEALLRYRIPSGTRWSELSERTTVMVKAARREKASSLRWWYIARFFIVGLLSLVGCWSQLARRNKAVAAGSTSKVRP